mgnify:CR=1 FL=1
MPSGCVSRSMACGMTSPGARSTSRRGAWPARCWRWAACRASALRCWRRTAPNGLSATWRSSTPGWSACRCIRCRRRNRSPMCWSTRAARSSWLASWMSRTSWPPVSRRISPASPCLIRPCLPSTSGRPCWRRMSRCSARICNAARICCRSSIPPAPPGSSRA